MTELAPPRDVLGHEIEAGDRIAYPKGAGSDGSHIVVGLVDAIENGRDRWRNPCRQLVVVPEASSESHTSTRVRRIWMTRKCVIIEKGPKL